MTTEAQSHLEQAYDHEEAGEIEAALAACDAAIAADPRLAQAHNFRGVVLELLDRPEAALAAYELAVQLDPDLTDAADNLSSLKGELAADRQLVTLATFSHPAEAAVPKSRLEAEGIWSFLANADLIAANWLYSNALGGVKLQVREEDVERANELLALEDEAPAYDEAALGEPGADETCPECGSLNIHYERFNKRWFFFSWLVLKFPLPVSKRRWVCRKCGYTWREDDGGEVR